jgi:hypothetical protein
VKLVSKAFAFKRNLYPYDEDEYAANALEQVALALAMEGDGAASECMTAMVGLYSYCIQLRPVALESAWCHQPLKRMKRKPGLKICFQMGQLVPLLYGDEGGEHAGAPAQAPAGGGE